MMLTRCPACQTVFRLRAEQLRARHGEVRCGHCFNPFNALEHLIAESAPAPQATDSTIASEAHNEPVAAPPSVEPDSTETIRLEDNWGAVEPPATETHTADAPSPPHPDLEPTAASQPLYPSDTEVPASSLLSDLDFDIPDELLATPPDTSASTRNEPRLEEIDFASFFKPDHDILQPPPAEETHHSALANEVQGDFPALIAHGDEHEYTPFARPSASPQSPAEQYKRIDADRHEPAAGQPLPDVIRAGRRAPGDARTEPGFASPERPLADLTETPSQEAEPVPAFIPGEADNEVITDHDDAAEFAPDTEHLDAVYGKPNKTSGLQRTLWGLALGLFAGTLAVQSIYLFRQDIAKSLPGLRPLLITACERLGCEMPLPREAALISIDTSDLQSDPGRTGRFVLHATVKNQADFVQAWPHLELTLTDATDTALARRVFSPAEWVASGRIDAGFSARGDAVVRQAFDVSALAPTGYRVYVFYP